MAKTASADDYTTATDAAGAAASSAAPELDYRPPRPRRYRPKIGLIGCGGITQHHLEAYREAGYDVAALCDLDRERAEQRRKDFYPEADLYTDAAEVFERSDIDVVDLATHPKPRAQLLLDAVAAGKHVLSQKPFVFDLDHGQRVIDAAAKAGVKVAVNQNGRWAPHVAWMRAAIREGLIGDIESVDASVYWNHNWCADTPFDDIPHLILYDFAIHWFDMVHCYTPGLTPRRISARTLATPTQRTRPPLLAQAMIEFDTAQASLQFRADTHFVSSDRTTIVGSKGTLVSHGPDLNQQTVTLHTESGESRPVLEGCWFPTGFDGTMSELLCAIEDDREPSNSAADNLSPLALAYAAMSATEQEHAAAVDIGSVRRMKPGWLSYAAETDTTA